VLPEGASSVVHAWTEAISSGQRIGTYDVTGCSWTDIGTPASYAKAVISELRNNGETVYIHPSVQSCNNVEMDGHVVIEQGSELNKGLSLRNCIVLPGTIPETREPDNTEFKNCILGPGFTIDLGESEMLGGSDVKDALLIGTGGSDRRYYRVRKNDHQVVLMQSPEDDPDFQRSIEYTRFFRKYSVPVPELIDADAKKQQAFFEDLGDLSLYSWLKCPRDRQQIEEIYHRVLDIALLIHIAAGKNISACPLLKERPFDYEHLRWETRYFLERFVKDIMHISIDDGAALDSEFHRLAEKVDSFPKTLIHRDFQSQNIMIAKGMTPRIIDYQGARIGPPAYDVASLLWDPYYRLEGTTRQRLIDYYNTRANNETLQSALLPCRLQRHMQALGAYGFLSAVKGKNYFLKYVPEGLRLLKEDITLARNDYPVLFRLIMKL
jgi:aminoglycoside/choline kinase family phosphotransferase